MIITEVWVPGNPRTKGSLSAKGGHAEDTPQSKRWRAMMAEQVRRDIERRCTGLVGVNPISAEPLPWPYHGAVDVEFVAFLARPPGGVSEVLNGVDPAAIWHNAGDVDKLARNVLDAIAADAKSAIMNGGAIINDNQVIRLVAEKYAARPGEQGLWLRVATVGQAELEWVANAKRETVERVRRAAVR